MTIRRKEKEEDYIAFTSALKMIERLLTEKRITKDEGIIPPLTKKELLKELHMNSQEFTYLHEKNYYKAMACRVCVPLATLYCKTKFVGGYK